MGMVWTDRNQKPILIIVVTLYLAKLIPHITTWLPCPSLLDTSTNIHPSTLDVGISLDCTIYARSLRKNLVVVSILTYAYPHGILAQNLCSSLLDASIPLDCTIHVKSLRRSFSSINPNKCCMKLYFIYLQLVHYLPYPQHERIYTARTIFSTLRESCLNKNLSTSNHEDDATLFMSHM